MREVAQRTIRKADPGMDLVDIAQKAIKNWTDQYLTYIEIDSSTVVDATKDYQKQLTDSLVKDVGEKVLGKLTDPHPEKDHHAVIKTQQDRTAAKKAIVHCDFVAARADIIDEIA